MNATREDVYDLVVIGGGQAGLATGHAARLAGLRHLIIDAGARTGDTWRDRYDSLTLFTPRAYSQLPGLDLEGDPDGYPTKDEIADYLEAYASTFDLPVQHSRPVRRVSATPGRGLSVETPQGSLQARSVVVATGPFQRPRTPEWAGELTVPQLHSAEYRNPGDVQGARVLVVGGGNSGAQIAEELARRGRAVTWAVSAAPRYVPSLVLGRSVFWWLDVTGVLTARGDSLRGRFLRRRGDPIFGGELREMIAEGRVGQAPVAVGAQGSHGERVVFADGSTDTFEGVVWCTGFVNDYAWLDIPWAIGPHGVPAHRAGISTADARVGFVGLGWQYSRNSGLVGGVGADASRIVARLSDQARLHKERHGLQVKAVS
jgi:putative flavoprotein involved in K+ transport